MRSIASSSLTMTFTTLSKWLCIAWIGLSLQGCLSTTQPAYPTELQMIIAAASNTNHANNSDVTAKTPGAISVAQLMQSLDQNKTPAVVKDTSNQSTDNSHSGWWINNSKPKPVATAGWIAQSPKQPLLNSPTTPQQRQLQLQYAPGQNLPYLAQLLKLRQLATTPNLTLISLSMGATSGQTPFNSAISAQKRITSLLNILNHPDAQPRTEYQPKLGDDQVVVTFKMINHTTATSKGQS